MSRARIVTLALFALAATQRLSAQSETIERIVIEGNQVVDEGTYLYHLELKPGEPYRREEALADFQRLWDTGFLDDLSLDVSDGETGKILTFIVKERPRVRLVDFRGSKELKPSEIQEKLEEENAAIPVDSFYDPGKIVRVERIIRSMLVDKGRANGAVSSEITPVEGGGIHLVFDIRDEQKIRIKTIDFAGADQFTNWDLRWGMKKTRESHFLGFLMGGSTFTEEKFSEDLEKLRELYLNQGYVNVSFGEPEMEYEDGYSRFLFWKRPTRWLHLTIPVSEGKQYRVGSVEVEGAEVFPAEFVKSFFKLEEGAIYDESTIIKGLDSLRELYGSRGYVQFTGFPVKRTRPDEEVVEVTINLQEDQQYFVNRIEFQGNTTTRDKVIRREIFLNEQEVMNMEALKLSIRRINQLGYFRPIEQPEIRPVAGQENMLDILLKVTEQNRNQFTFGGGVSGLEGTFINLSFSTTNFLGRGETASFSVQTGSRTQNYQIALTDPWFLDKPITVGFDLFKRKLLLPQFTRQDTGGSLIFGLPMGRFSRMFFNYNYSVIKTSEPELDPDDLTIYDIFAGQFGSIFLDPRFFGLEGNFTQSKVTPSFVHNTTDNPIFPFKGVRYTGSFEFAGGPLGGTVDFYKPSIEGVWYLPVSRTTNLGFRVMASWLQGFGGDRMVDVTPDGVFDVQSTGIPFFERFFLGGENQIRGYDIRSVGPRRPDEEGRLRLIGGDKMLLFNMEYYIPLAGPLRAVLFFDAGQAYAEDEPWSFSMFEQLRTSTGGELRFFVPVLNVPFRLIFAFNPHRDFFQPATAFRFGIGTTF